MNIQHILPGLLGASLEFFIMFLVFWFLADRNPENKKYTFFAWLNALMAFAMLVSTAIWSIV